MNAQRLRFRVLVYVSVVAVMAAITCGLMLRFYPPQLAVEFWVFCVVAAGAEFYAVTFPSGAGASLSYPLSVAGLVLLGPAGGALAASASTLTSVRRGREDFWAVFVFNLSQVTLSAALAGWVYMSLGGRALVGQPLTSADFPAIVVPFAAMIVASMLLNYVLVGMYFVLREQATFRQFWKSTISWMTPTQVALGIAGLAIAQIVALVGVAGLALFVAPLLVARETYNRYIRLREAYSDTVRSLVGAIEAKDPYTMGHSVRVAEYTIGIARHMAIDEPQLERLEYAALLHDLGKVGIPRSLLAKPAALTATEIAEIRRHPDIGASIIETVPYLEDIVSTVQHHHERVDGAGYSAGLAGIAIPLPARILAVADSYDAMTSERPYRSALSTIEALRELEAHSGSQFDEDVVRAMVSYLDSARIDASDLEQGTAHA